MKNWLINLSVFLNVLTLLYGGLTTIAVRDIFIENREKDRKTLATLKSTNQHLYAIIDHQYSELQNEILILQGQLEILDTSIKADEKRKARIRHVAQAIRDTLPERHPFKECRRKPTPGTINTIAINVVDRSQQYGVSESLLLGIIRRESAFCQEAISRAGAQGLMQLMPETAEYQAKEIKAESGYSPKPWRIKDNIWLGTYYISKRLIDFEGNEDLALKAYNAGFNHVKQVLSGEREDYYPEPKKYSSMVLHFKNEYQAMGLD